MAKTLLQLKHNECRFPVGTSKEGEHTFCASRKAVGVDYCADHLKIMFVEPKKRIGAPFVHKALV